MMSMNACAHSCGHIAERVCKREVKILYKKCVLKTTADAYGEINCEMSGALRWRVE